MSCTSVQPLKCSVIQKDTKRKMNVSNGQALTDELVEKSDWSKHDVNEMVSRVKTGIQETGVNVEIHIYDQLKKNFM